MSSHEWDVLVVGGGPAGSRAAELAAEGGARVLMVDRRRKIGVPVQCAEFLHNKVVRKLDVPPSIVAQEVDGMVTHVFGGLKAITRAPGCILHRDRFDAFLAERAEKAGAEIWLQTMAIEPIMGGRGQGPIGAVLEDETGDRVRIRARVIIGADGPMSTVGSWVDQENEEMLVAHQRTVKLYERLKRTEVFLHPDYPGGYGWLFPKGKYANVGVGVERSIGGHPGSALRDLITSLGDRIGPMVSKTAGHIPVGGPLKTIVGRVLLVGDAGGFTHPITGGGVHHAVESGAMAGEAAARFVAGGNLALREYVRDWEALFGRSLSHAVKRRNAMVLAWRRSSSDQATFLALMKRSWIAFKEYHRP